MAKFLRRIFYVLSVCLLACFIFIYPSIAESDETKTPLTVGPVQKIMGNSSTHTTTSSDGITIIRDIINGPPKPPPGFEVARQAVALPKPNPAMATNTLTVPAFNWVFGCSSVSGAMIAGYYDRNGYPNMYSGPTNGGVMPLDNSSWPTWSDGIDTYPNLPLAASHNGVDGRVTRGSIDDYWISYGSSANDPYITGGWTQHTWSDGQAIGDYMKTSQSAYYNTDGSSSFWNYPSASQLTCSAMESLTSTDIGGHYISWQDATYGRKLFYEARGYTVTTCYNQPTDNKYAGGFSFAQFKAEIDAGRPVILNLFTSPDGHTIVGVGYNDTGNTVYIHDTWDYSTHTMTWGGSYSGMALRSVSIVNLLPATQPNLTPYKPEVWSDKIVVSNTTGTYTNTSPIYTTDSLYVDWAVINDGAGATSATFSTKLYVDEVEKHTWYSDPPLNTNFYSYVSDYSIGTLSAGDHTIKIVTDTTGVITESNEADNEYTRTISVIGGACPNPPVKVNSNYFDTVQEAYNSAANGNTVQIQEYLFSEDVLLNRNITTILKGGYNCQYGTNTGYTTVNGSVTINNGSVTIEKLIIK